MWNKNLSDISVVFLFETKRFLRRRRLIAIALIEALIIILPTVVRLILGYSPVEDAKSFMQSELGYIDWIIILTASFFAGDAISGEFERKTSYVLFPNPVKRFSIFIGKLLASYVFSALFVSVYYLYVVGETIYYFGDIPVETFSSIIYALLYLLAVTLLAFMFSSLMTSGVFSTLLVFFTLFLIMPIVTSIHSIIGIEPWYILSYHSKTITQVFNPPEQRIQKIQFGQDGVTIWIFNPDPVVSIAVFLIYIVVCALVAYLVFVRREVKG